MATWTATITLTLGTLSTDYIKKYIREYQDFFVDVDNPTEEEIRRYFDRVQDNYAGSNDGSELIANAKIKIERKDS